MRTNVKLRLLSVLLAVVLCATMLTACGGSKLDGTYHSQGLISQSFTFDGDQVTMSAFGVNASGTYRIEGDQIIITNVINIGGTEFEK